MRQRSRQKQITGPPKDDPNIRTFPIFLITTHFHERFIRKIFLPFPGYSYKDFSNHIGKDDNIYPISCPDYCQQRNKQFNHTKRSPTLPVLNLSSLFYSWEICYNSLFTSYEVQNSLIYSLTMSHLVYSDVLQMFFNSLVSAVLIVWHFSSCSSLHHYYSLLLVLS